ncbi:erythromycin esterase family protein [Nocardia sp. NBC_01730]|uniref:erythromycin esterase family protein n=1 Tax=Nocardia sp. NBC_01730 TaxID=2975998 RepID=UPI002E141C86|nr:erythromycin esterase family protein [Nocardia sp. NBC_01730]
MTASIKDAAHVVDAATVMGLLPARPRLLALGEPTHGEDVLLELRNDLFRQLVEQEGYRTIAIESDCMMGLVVDDYVTSGTGDLDDVMERGFSHEWGAFAANRELVRWMRAYNHGRPVSQQMRFAGFDGPLEITGAASPRESLAALHTYLTAWVDADLLPCRWATCRWNGGAPGRSSAPRLGEEYAFIATALGTIRHHGVEIPPPDTVEGLLYALPEYRYVVDARRLAAILRDVTPAPRVSPWFGYSPLDPAHVAGADGIIFVKDAPPS